MIFVIGLGIIFGAAMIVCMPLFRGTLACEEADVDDASVKWEKQKREAYSAIKEADLDFKMGKLTDEDYRAIRGAEEARALEALKELEDAGQVAGGKGRR